LIPLAFSRRQRSASRNILVDIVRVASRRTVWNPGRLEITRCEAGHRPHQLDLMQRIVAARNRRKWNFAATDFLEARRQTPSPSGRLGRWLARFTESRKQLYGAECRVPTRPILAAAAS
jgi:hypothetical protein